MVSGVLARWLVGMAAFFATMGRTIIGKYIPVLLAVTAFVSAGFQHSPANMGFFSLESGFGGGVDWATVFAGNLAPAGLGNVIGGGVAVAALLSWVYANSDAPKAARLNPDTGAHRRAPVASHDSVEP
ncbi:formate/nitrite transporter family protein [Demequina sp.]|uniref:formate/nitrite transporter family protein n=1 Tax=Demequina sp. TaxID=2050685 RepID=UPI0025C60332|nr:formate/nitrite transporter family protein [Demequina sp.]